MSLLEADYIDTGKVKYVAHPFYLGNPEMGFAAEAAWCAQDQGEYFAFQHALYENQGNVTFNQNTVNAIAASLGLDTDAFAQCMSNREHQDDVENARRAATNKGINSTPTFFVNNQRVEGNQPLSVFKQIIEQELAIAQ